MNKKNILVVDDETDLLDVMRIWIQDSGNQPLLAADGVQALEIVKTIQPDLIFLDIMMPKIDGFEVLQRLKRNPSTVNVPIVMLTARGDTGAIMEAQRMHADDFLTKPIEMDELLATIKRFV